MIALPFAVVVADPAWRFGDKLNPKGEVKRGADAQYLTMPTADIAALPVGTCMADDAIGVVWRPSALAADGDLVLRAWGFRPVGEWVWSKRPPPPTAAEIEAILVALVARAVAKGKPPPSSALMARAIAARIGRLHFGLGRLTRAAKEVAAVGVRGSPYGLLADRAIRDIFEAPAGPHSVKTEIVQDAIERMFPGGPYLELFARRARPKWLCVGNECPDTLGQDIRDVVPALARRIAKGRAALVTP